MSKDEMGAQDEGRKAGWEFSKLRKLKIYTYVQNKLEALIKRDPLIGDTLSGKRFDLKNPTRENYDLALATCLVRSGKLTDEEIQIILKNFFAHGMGSTAPDDYFEKMLNRAHEAISGRSEQKTSYSYKNMASLAQSLESFADELKKRKERNKSRHRTSPGFDTGFPRLNEAGGGIVEQRMTLLAGKSGVGRTPLALQMAGEAARLERIQCVYVSYDQSAFDMNLMVYARLAGLAHATIAAAHYSDKQYERMQKLARKEIDEWGNLLNFVQADETFTITSLRSLCEEVSPNLLVIDPLERLPTGRNYPSAQQRIPDVLDALSRIAVEYHVSLLVVATINGEVGLSDLLRGDLVLHLIDEPPSSPESINKLLKIEKNRFGPRDVTLLLEYDPLLFGFKEKGML
jgi:predicted ATP-dependent serine protease